MKQGNKTLYYNYRTIDGYNAPINVVISKRGLGKTFGRVFRSVRRFMVSIVDALANEKRFIYVVETEDMIQELSQNRGEKFFSAILDYLEKNPSARNNKLYDFLMGNETELTEGDVLNKIKGGTIIIGGRTAGYIVSLNGFAKLKRNNFVNVSEIIVDEFIPENVDIRTRKNAYKVVSIVQSIARTNGVKVYLLGNSIRLNDPILIKLKLTNLKPGEFRRVYDKYGLLVVCHFVSNEQYKSFTEKADASVAGRLASLMGEDNLEENEFSDETPKELVIPDKCKPSHLLFCLHGEEGSIRINVTKDYSFFYVFEDYGKNTTQRYCFDQKFISPVVQYFDGWRDHLINRYQNGTILFENSNVYYIFKSILKLA